MQSVVNSGAVSNPETAKENQKKRGIKKAIVFDYDHSGVMRPHESATFIKQPIKFKADCYADIGDWSIVMVEEEIDALDYKYNAVQKLLDEQKRQNLIHIEKFNNAIERFKKQRGLKTQYAEENKLLTKQIKELNNQIKDLKNGVI